MHGHAIKGSWIHPTYKVEAGSEVVNSSMDRHSFCGYYCEILWCDIGSFCSIANQVVIGGGMHPMDWVSTSPVFYAGRDSVKMKYSEHIRPDPARTILGHDIWIGERAIIRQGVQIGTGAVVGMGSVVTRDVEPYAVVAGTPARVIRYRFPVETINRLLASEWWACDDEAIRRAAVHIKEPHLFLEVLCR